MDSSLWYVILACISLGSGQSNNYSTSAINVVTLNTSMAKASSVGPSNITSVISSTYKLMPSSVVNDKQSQITELPVTMGTPDLTSLYLYPSVSSSFPETSKHSVSDDAVNISPSQTKPISTSVLLQSVNFSTSAILSKLSSGSLRISWSQSSFVPTNTFVSPTELLVTSTSPLQKSRLSHTSNATGIPHSGASSTPQSLASLVGTATSVSQQNNDTKKSGTSAMTSTTLISMAIERSSFILPVLPSSMKTNTVTLFGSVSLPLSSNASLISVHPSLFRTLNVTSLYMEHTTVKPTTVSAANSSSTRVVSTVLSSSVNDILVSYSGNTTMTYAVIATGTFTAHPTVTSTVIKGSNLSASLALTSNVLPSSMFHTMSTSTVNDTIILSVANPPESTLNASLTPSLMMTSTSLTSGVLNKTEATSMTHVTGISSTNNASVTPITTAANFSAANVFTSRASSSLVDVTVRSSVVNITMMSFMVNATVPPPSESTTVAPSAFQLNSTMASYGVRSSVGNITMTSLSEGSIVMSSGFKLNFTTASSIATVFVQNATVTSSRGNSMVISSMPNASITSFLMRNITITSTKASATILPTVVVNVTESSTMVSNTMASVIGTNRTVSSAFINATVSPAATVNGTMTPTLANTTSATVKSSFSSINMPLTANQSSPSFTLAYSMLSSVTSRLVLTAVMSRSPSMSSSPVFTPSAPTSAQRYRITINASCDNELNAKSSAFREAVVTSIGNSLEIDPSRITIVSVTCGSIYVVLTITNAEKDNVTGKMSALLTKKNFTISYKGMTLEVISALPIPATTPKPKNDDKTALIIYIVFGVVLGLAFLIGLIALIIRCRRERTAGMFHLPNEEQLELSGFTGAPKSRFRQGDFYGEVDMESGGPGFTIDNNDADLVLYNDSALEEIGENGGTGFDMGYLPEWKNLPTVDLSEAGRADEQPIGSSNTLLTYGNNSPDQKKKMSNSKDSVASFDNPFIDEEDGDN